MKFSAQRSTPRVGVIHHADDRGVWASYGRQIFHAIHPSAPWKPAGEFPFAGSRDLLAFSRLSRRVFRSDKCNVYPTRAGKLLGIRSGKVYRLEEQGAIPLFDIRGDCVMNRAIAEDERGDLYFGEYFMNPRREPVRIWRVDALLEDFSVAFTFDQPRTRHVHAVHADPYVAGRLWITMGDFEGECFLAYTDDGFSSVNFLGDGSQLWRMVGVIFQERRLCWLTDSHIVRNRIVSMDRSSHRTVVHGERDASSWYVAETDEGIYLATTTVEPGPQIHTDRVRLLASEDGTDWEEIVEYPKDAFPMRAFGFGSLSLPSGCYSADAFWISGEGIRGLDGRSQLCCLGLNS